MDKESKTLIILFALMITSSIVYSYYKYIIKEDVIFYVDEEAFNAALSEGEEEEMISGYEDSTETLESEADANFNSEVTDEVTE